MSSKEPTVFVTRGDTKRTLHTTPDCPQLSRARTVMEKPASVFPPGYLDKCSACHEGEQ